MWLSDRRFSQSLERGLAILNLFTPARALLGIAEIAEELGLSRAATHRYMITLVALGYLEQGAKRKYQLGLRVTDLGMAALNSSDLRERARPHLLELQRRTSHTAGIAVLARRDVLCLDCVRSSRCVSEPGLGLGSRLPVYCTATGKVLLANLPGPEQYGLIRAMKLRRRGPNTITSKALLRRELEDIQAAGLAAGDQELAAALFEVAAPVRDEDLNVIAMIGIAVHSAGTVIEELLDSVGPQLLNAAEQISSQHPSSSGGEGKRP